MDDPTDLFADITIYLQRTSRKRDEAQRREAVRQLEEAWANSTIPRQPPDHPCPVCGETKWGVAHCYDGGKHYLEGWFCQTCDRRRRDQKYRDRLNPPDPNPQ